MSINEILSQEELGALVEAMADGAFDGELPERSNQDNDNAMEYDLTAPSGIDSIYLPTLELINDRLLRLLRVSLYNVLRKNAEVTSGGVQVLTLAEYLSTLPSPTSLNMLRLQPMHATSLLVFEPHLITTVVDLFFGGVGEVTPVGGRELTVSETRISQMLMRQVTRDVKTAWASMLKIDFDFLSTETNPQFATAIGVSDGEVMIVTVINVMFDAGGGAFHILLPYAMLEPLRSRLTADVQSTETGIDVEFRRGLVAGLGEVELEVDATLASVDLTLDELLHLSPGDILPMEFSSAIPLRIAGIPVWQGEYGKTGNARALRITGPHPRS